MKRIVFNSDVGEEAGFDAEIMPFISWCNISCGSHAGNDVIIQKTIKLAMKHNVKIGAHPSYPDRENFGRVSLDISYNDLVSTVTSQIKKVKFYVEQAGGKLHHVKPHGALYNDVFKNNERAQAVLESVKSIDKSLSVITQENSKLSYVCKDLLMVKNEVFADRNYNEDLTLVSRSNKNAVLKKPKEVFEHVSKMVLDSKIKTLKGEECSVFFDTICVHGDNPNSVSILDHLYKKFSELNFTFK